MAILVLVMLLIVWAVVLGPGLWRRRSVNHSTDSIHAFHRALRVLQRTGDPVVAPAHRLRVAGPSVMRSDRVADGRPTLLLVRPDSAPPRLAPEMRRPHLPVDETDPYFRPDACRRRRDVFVGLVASIVVFGPLGAVPSLRPLLVVTLVVGLVLVAYVVLLLRLRAMALERRARRRMAARALARASAFTGAPTDAEAVVDVPDVRVAAR